MPIGLYFWPWPWTWPFKWFVGSETVSEILTQENIRTGNDPRWVISRSRHSRGVWNSEATFTADKILFKTLDWQIPTPSYQKNPIPWPLQHLKREPLVWVPPLVTLSSKLSHIKATHFLNRVPGERAASGALPLLLFIASDVGQHYYDPQCEQNTWGRQ